MDTYRPDSQRYASMPYRRCGRSGLKLSAISLGLWHNFGHSDRIQTERSVVTTAFDHGITHFDLANNYGPPPGAAEEAFGVMLRQDLAPYRDEIIVSTKAGYTMWPGPYGDWGSRKYLVSSVDQSLKRMGLEYVDIFYHHRPDPQTPLEETMGALGYIASSGRALYIGLSNYPPELLPRAASLLRELGAPCVIHQPRYSMLDRRIESGLLDVLDQEGIGCIAFSPLAQGVLTDRYLTGSIPPDSRAARPNGFLRPEHLTLEKIAVVGKLTVLAAQRGQTLAQMALSWVLRHAGMTSVLIGASQPCQVLDAVKAADMLDFSAETLQAIDQLVAPLQPS
jgi:L-glyceraldehyde 3-phosphate reductase